MDNSTREKTKRKFDKRFWLFLFLTVLYIGYMLYEYHQSQQPVNTPIILEDSQTTVITADGELHIHMIDCGQGDAFLFECNGLYGLIDSGPKRLIDSGPNKGKNAVVEYLKSQNIDELQFVVGTHHHEDHMGAMYMILEEFDTEIVYIPDLGDREVKTQWYKRFNNQVETKEINVVNPKTGDEFYLDEAKFKVVCQLTPEEAGSDFNNYSTVIKVSFGEMDILMTGDAENRVEKAMLKSDEDLQCEVLKLGHHGSDTSSSSAFLEAVNPTYALISCGVGNSYHHPCIETIEKMEASDIEVYRTDELGNVVLSVTDSSISFNTSPGDYLDGDSLAQKRGIVIYEEELYGD